MTQQCDDYIGAATVRERPKRGEPLAYTRGSERAQERPARGGGMPLAYAHGSEKAQAWLWVPLVVLAGYLLFCHGCHGGDHDDELIVFTLGFPSIRKHLSRS